MKFYEPQDRTPLLPALLALWEAPVRATHLFLSDAEILHIKEYVPQALLGVAHLIAAEADNGAPSADASVPKRKRCGAPRTVPDDRRTLSLSQKTARPGILSAKRRERTPGLCVVFNPVYQASERE